MPINSHSKKFAIKEKESINNGSKIKGTVVINQFE